MKRDRPVRCITDFLNSRYGGEWSLAARKSSVWLCDDGRKVVRKDGVHMLYEKDGEAGVPVQFEAMTPKGERCLTMNLVGQRFGRLVVLYHTRRPGTRNVFAFCQCDCGRTCEPTNHALKIGATVSCGCFRRKVAQITRGTAVKLVLENERLTDENEALKSRIKELERMIDDRGI